jgi:hypothetical protein
MKISKRKLRLIVEAYIKRHVADPQGGAIRQEIVAAPSRFDVKKIEGVYQTFFYKTLYGLATQTRKDYKLPDKNNQMFVSNREEYFEFIKDLESNFNVDSARDYEKSLRKAAVKPARNQTERYVNTLLQASKETSSDYPGEGTKLVDATRRSTLYYTDNDFPVSSFPDPENQIPTDSLMRIAFLPHNELDGVAPGAIQHHPGTQGTDIDAWVESEAERKREKTDPQQGESIVDTGIGSLKRPDNFTPDPKFISVPIDEYKDEEYDDRDTFS